MRPFLLLLVTSFALGCAADTTEPRTARLSPQFAVATTAAEFPNVVRFRDQYVFGIQDPETDLLAIAGLPDDPKQSYWCGGNEPFATVDFQYVGLLQDAIKGLMKGGDVNLHVYTRSTFWDVCVSTPIAQGKGRVMYVDNDVFFTGGKNDTFGWRMEGPVSLAAGGTANLLAHNLWQALPNGTFRRIFRKVRLSAQ